ncbi:MAG: adenylate kinase family protein [Candidatus Helarchaeota archaeon]
MKKKSIIISGTPGTGKSSISKKLGESLGLKVINIGDLAIKENFIISKDDKRDTLIIKEKKLISRLKKIIKNSETPLILECHFADIIPSEFVELVIILRTHPLILEKRLEKKGYKKRKINENVAAEILGVCTANALNKYDRDIIFEVDTSNLDIIQSVQTILKIIKSRPREYKVGHINWMKELAMNKELEKFFNNK